jgi:maltooligosyltrehalose trehalohydrolase
MSGHVFRVWAPEKERMFLHVLSPSDERLEMRREQGPEGYFSLEVPGAGPGTRYKFILDDGNEYPDPASHFQPEGVHGPSQVVDHRAYSWKTAQWPQRPFREWILYELHIGTFTPEGTFEAAIGRLDDLLDLGVNAIEIMPVAAFPGARNWGYDGVYPYAVQESYGGPDGLKALVDACHARGIAVVLDVVYNHLGPEGNHAARFGPYFTAEYRTPWGEAVNLDGPWSGGARDFILGNMRHWFGHYRIDALRLDAIHAVYDKSATHLWEEARACLLEWRKELGREVLLIAESDLNNPKVVTGVEEGGYGFDAQWLDDFHHALYVLVDPKGKGHYEDFGSLEQLAKAYTEGFVHSGEWTRFRRRRHGAPSAEIPCDRFVVFNQNHDQAGNRVRGERLSALVDPDRLKVAAAAMLLSPYVPLLFMGEEYAEKAPFLFFIDYGDAELSRSMQEGRKREFAVFKWGEGEPPDPSAEKTFLDTKLDWNLRGEAMHAEMLRWHKDLIALRRTAPFLSPARTGVTAQVIEGGGLILGRHAESDGKEAACLFNFSDQPLDFSLPEGGWVPVLNSRAVGAPASGARVRDGMNVPGWTAVVLFNVRVT